MTTPTTSLPPTVQRVFGRERPFDPAAELPAPASLFGYLVDPVLWSSILLFLVMVGLSIDHPTVSNIAFKLRWPVLGLAAFVGVFTALNGAGVRWTASHVSMALVVVAGLASASYSDQPSYSFQRAISVGLLFGATLIGVGAAARSPLRLVRLTDYLWGMGAFLVMLGFVYRMGDGLGESRFGGLQSRATGAGTFAALFLPIAVYQVRYRLKGAMVAVGWMVIALFLLQLVLASARMALFSSLLTCTVLWFDYYGRKAIAAVAVMIVLSPLALLPALADKTVRDKLAERSAKVVRIESIGNFTGRLERWQFGLEMWQLRPLQGFGFGVSRTLASKVDPQRFGLEDGEVFNLHSDQIEVMMDLGLLGFVPFAVFWLTLIGFGVRVAFAPRTPARQLTLAYLGCSFYAFGDTFMHGGFLAAGGGVAAFTWSMIAVVLELGPKVWSARPGVVPAGAALQDPTLEVGPASPRTRPRERLRERLPSVRDLSFR
ncbi:MAG: O-antigen ligase family protein [Planctomycetia bacterium]